MVVVRKDSAAAPQHAMQRLRDPNAEPLHPARESALVVSLRDEVQVLPQDGELDHPMRKGSERARICLL